MILVKKNFVDNVLLSQITEKEKETLRKILLGIYVFITFIIQRDSK